MTKQEKAEAKRQRRANRRDGFSDYGRWNAHSYAEEDRAEWSRKRGGPRFPLDAPIDPADTRTRALPPRAAQALAMVAALAAPTEGNQGAP